MKQTTRRNWKVEENLVPAGKKRIAVTRQPNIPIEFTVFFSIPRSCCTRIEVPQFSEENTKKAETGYALFTNWMGKLKTDSPLSRRIVRSFLDFLNSGTLSLSSPMIFFSNFLIFYHSIRLA